MFSKRSVFVLIAVIFGLTEAALMQTTTQVEINIVPSSPSANDAISAELSGVWNNGCVPRRGDLSINGSAVRIQVQSSGDVCTQALTPWSLTVSIGRLSPGDYQLEVVRVSGSTSETIGRKSFSVTRPGRADDHDDNGAVESGYAVITSATTSGMAVFASFGFKRGEETMQSGVLPSALTTNALLFVNSSGELSRNLGVAITNPGSATANITLTLRKEDGSTVASKAITVTSRQQISRFITELFSDQSGVPTDLTGTLTIASSTPVSIVGLRFRGVNFSTLPVTNLSSPAAVPQISTGVGGANAALLPQFASGGGWATEVVIANGGAAALSARVDLFKSDGSPLTAKLNGESASSFTNLAVPAGGVLVLAPRDSRGNSRF